MTKSKYNKSAPTLFSEEQMEAMVVRKHNYPMIKYVGKNGEKCLRPDTRKTKERFVEQARAIWGNQYDYTDSVYIGNKKPITIYCPKHDYHFKVGMAQNHLMKRNATGCPVCHAEQRHGCEYGKDWRKYLKVCAKNNLVGLKENMGYKKLDPEEKARRKAERKANADAAREVRKAQRRAAYEERLRQQKEETQRRHEAEKAARAQARAEKEKQRIKELQERILSEGPLKQGAGYQYRDIEKAVNGDSHVLVHCPNPDHEWHPMLVHLILQGCKCRECAGRHQPKEQRCADFIRKSKKKYKKDFDYSRVPSQYVNNDTPIEIRCMKHGNWFKVTPDTHLRKYGGCPICNYSKGETSIYLWLEEHGIKYEYNSYHLTHTNMFCKVGYLVPDFWLPDHNTIIEYNGEQHYKDIKHFRRDKNWRLEDQQERDRTLRDICRERGIRLIEISYEQYDDIAKILNKAFKFI